MTTVATTEVAVSGEPTASAGPSMRAKVRAWRIILEAFASMEADRKRAALGTGLGVAGAEDSARNSMAAAQEGEAEKVTA